MENNFNIENFFYVVGVVMPPIIFSGIGSLIGYFFDNSDAGAIWGVSIGSLVSLGSVYLWIDDYLECKRASKKRSRLSKIVEDTQQERFYRKIIRDQFQNFSSDKNSQYRGADENRLEFMEMLKNFNNSPN